MHKWPLAVSVSSHKKKNLPFSICHCRRAQLQVSSLLWRLGWCMRGVSVPGEGTGASWAPCGLLGDCGDPSRLQHLSPGWWGGQQPCSLSDGSPASLGTAWTCPYREMYISWAKEKCRLTRDLGIILVWLYSSTGEKIIFPSAQFLSRKVNGMGNAIVAPEICPLVTAKCKVMQTQPGKTKALSGTEYQYQKL